MPNGEPAKDFGLCLAPEEVLRISKRIQKNEGQFLHRQSNRITIWRIDGMRVVYDNVRHVVVTFLPDEQRSA